VINLSPDICRKFKEARRAAKLGQIELAAEIGCKQSALSMFENGNGTKLSDSAVEKLSKKFGIELKETEKEEAAAPVANLDFSAAKAFHPAAPLRGFCPNPNCPSNRAYQVEGRTFLRPERQEADPVGGRYCAICGEVLVKRCPNCGAPVHDGAICSLCGDPYLAL